MTYKLEQRTKTWHTIAVASDLGELSPLFEKLATRNGKRIVRSDGKIVYKQLPLDYR